MGKLRSLGVVVIVILASLFTVLVHSHHHHPYSCVRGYSSYLERLKALFREAQAAIFPPTLDFRVSWPWSWRGGGDDINGGVEKQLEEAIGKSLENAKRTMEDSAKAVAQTLQHKPKSDHMMMMMMKKMMSTSPDQDHDNDDDDDHNHHSDL